LNDWLKEAHGEFLSGTQYGDWFAVDRNLVRNELGPIRG
jgi:hypothetical protein